MQQFACFCVPYANCFIVATRDNIVGIDLDCADEVGVAGQTPEEFTSMQVPDLDCHV
jgi:hypothetical protein